NSVYKDVYAYPNPVRHEYSGIIYIKGLVKDTDVKITDIAGNIVYQTKSNGGMATWDGNNFDGQRVSTGIYLIFCLNTDGSDSFVSKLLFIK
ncbi:MAG: T9SS type A sorting domain-containing protein, partial [Bacteroidota bacterium]|nr:T9SS type A sorting domain-containing protein [Bacteroidota bacterium]